MTIKREQELSEKLAHKEEFYRLEGMTGYAAILSAHDDLEAEIGQTEYSEFNAVLNNGSIGTSNSF